MMNDTCVSALSRTMKSRGFEYYGPTATGHLQFRGTVTANGAVHLAHVAVKPGGLELPDIWVKLPSDVAQVLAHVGPNGHICYAAEGSIVPDIFDVPGQALACIERAEQVLDQSLRGEMRQDLEDEFFAFWNGDFCFLDVSPSYCGSLEVICAGREAREVEVAFVTNNVERTRLKLGAMGFRDAGLSTLAAFKVHTNTRPKPLQANWPPHNVAALLQWQGLLERNARRNIERRLIAACASGKSAAVCVVQSPVAQYAFWVEFRGVPNSRLDSGTRMTLYASTVRPLMTLQLDDAYLAGRSTPGRKSLLGKRIALIGCGTIGGFLAELLVKSGAGLDGGELLLLDQDILLPQNVGRHRLGLNRVLQNKAVALASELNGAAPTANIRSLPVKAEEAELSRADLIINATGEEALGHLLTRRAADTGHFVPMLSVWVEGPGVAVRALLRDSLNGGCTRCMANGKREQLFPVVNESMPQTLVGHGCESLYVPFSAVVSVQAACLAVEMASDWVNGKPAPRLRTRLTGMGYSQGAPDCDVPRQHSCPACSS